MLALEVLTRTLPDNSRACVVVENRLVSFCSAEAARHGIHNGLSISTAQALDSELCILERQAMQEQAALEALADCALRFSPMACLQPPQALLLEIAGRAKQAGDEGVFDLIAEYSKKHHDLLGYTAVLHSARG